MDTHTHTHTFNGPFSGTTQVSRYQKGKTNQDFTEERDSEWQRHQLGRMQVCTLLQIDNQTSTPPLCFYRPDALPAAQPTASKHWRLFFSSWHHYYGDDNLRVTDSVQCHRVPAAAVFDRNLHSNTNCIIQLWHATSTNQRNVDKDKVNQI